MFVCDVLSPIVRIHRSRKLGLEVEGHLYYPSDVTSKSLLLVSVTSCPADLDTLIQREECYHQETYCGSIKVELKTATQLPWASHAFE